MKDIEYYKDKPFEFIKDFMGIEITFHQQEFIKKIIPQKYLECECCSFLAVIPEHDNHENLICPFCRNMKCEHGGKFIIIQKSEFIKKAGLGEI